MYPISSENRARIELEIYVRKSGILRVGRKKEKQLINKEPSGTFFCLNVEKGS